MKTRRRPAPSGGTRIPLSVGLASLRSSARVAFLVWPSTVLFLGMLWMGPVLGDLFGKSTIGATLGMILLVLSMLFGIVGWAMASDAGDEAKRERPSDLILDARGLRVEGGRHDGVTLLWQAITGASVEELPKADKFGIRHAILWAATLGMLSRWARRVYVLRLATKSEPIALATSDDDGEIASMREVAAAIQAAIAPPVEKTGPALLSCAECAAPLAPADAASVTCPFCGKANQVPGELRERLRLPSRVRGVERAVARLVSQPGPRSALAALTFFRWIGHLVWPFAIVLVFVLIVIWDASPASTTPRFHDVDRAAAAPWGRAWGVSALLPPVLLAAARGTPRR